MGFVTERRKRARVALHWRVFLSKKGNTGVIETETRDVSSQGFYCLSHEAVTPGERLECVIIIPLSAWRHPEESLRLRCLVRVARVEVTADGRRYGIGCWIEDYTVVHAAAEARALA